MENILIITRALSDASRVRAVMALIDYPELCACQLIELLELAPATVSRHMSVLHTAGLVDSRKEGRWVHFRLRRTPKTAAVLEWLSKELAKDPSVRGDAKRLKTITTCDLDSLCQKIKAPAKEACNGA